jgi:uncharacterized protein
MEPESKPKPKLDYVIHNCHTHLFTMDYIPRYFISRAFPTDLAKKKWVARLGMFLFKKHINRYAAFFFSAMNEGHEGVWEELKSYYPRTARFCVLSVDFDYMNAGMPKYPFLRQIEDLHLLAKKVNEKENKLIPFLGIDPRRPGLFDLVREYVEEKGFRGLKLYPGQGFFPNDPRLDQVYAYAEKYQLPITTHCIPVNKNHFRYRPTKEMIAKASTMKGIYDEKDAKNSYRFAKYLNHPYWYGELLKDFPNLKINLAHFGGNEEWNKYLDNTPPRTEKDISWYSLIRDLLKNHPNVYADISFTVYDRSLYPLLKNLLNSEYQRTDICSPKDKVLFGTDFYMLQKDYKERRFGIDLRGYLSDEEYWQIAEVNPKRFLETKV